MSIINLEEVANELEGYKQELDDCNIHIGDGISTLLEALESGEPLPPKEIAWLRQTIQESHVWLNELSQQLFVLTAHQP